MNGQSQQPRVNDQMAPLRQIVSQSPWGQQMHAETQRLQGVFNPIPAVQAPAVKTAEPIQPQTQLVAQPQTQQPLKPVSPIAHALGRYR